jgi:hypothetical protein
VSRLELIMNNLETSDAARWLGIIQSEYREMPGLSLTKPQMQRLWGLESDTCEHLVNTLVVTHVLRQTPNGGYVATAASV